MPTLPGVLRHCGLVLILLLSAAGISRAQATLPAKSQANVLARALAYDRNLKARAGDTIVVGIVFAPSSSASSTEAEEMFQAFKALEKFVLLGLPLRVEKIAFTDATGFKAAVKDHDVDALFICAALDSDITAITGVSHDLDKITMTAQRRYVTSGVAIGSVVVENKPAILFNRQASEAEGSQFTSQFLGLTTAVDSQ